MDAGSFRIARIGGIDIKVHWSWAIILILMTWTLAVAQFPRSVPGESDGFYWLLGFLAAVMLFVSVLLHELSHSFLARARGLNVRDITLFIFGGVSNIEEEPKQAGDEFLIAAVGPLMSFALAAVFYLLAQVVTPHEGSAGAGLAALLAYLALINFWLGLFNMIPGFPLDGGRVLRSIIWGVNHNFRSATRIAGFIGQLVAYGFIAWGVVQTFYMGDLGGLWIAFIGWFLLNAAQQSVTSVVLRDALRGITVGQVMQPAPPVVGPALSLGELLSNYVLPYNLRALPVVGPDGRVIGIVTLADIKDIPQERWGMVTVGQVMTGADKLKTVNPQDSLDKVMQLLSDGELDQLPVVDPATGRLVGMLSRAHVLRWLQIRDELKLNKPAQPVSGGPGPVGSQQ